MDSCVSESDRTCYEHVIRAYKRRCRARSLLPPYRKDDLDSQLSQAILSSLREGYMKTITARRIVHLLGLGATASKLPEMDYGGNVGEMVVLIRDAKYSGYDKPFGRRLFYVLNHLIVSSCDSWYKQYYSQHINSPTIVEFMFDCVLQGDPDHFYIPTPIEIRYRAWSLYKKMVWVIEYANSGKEYSGLIPFDPSIAGRSGTLQATISFLGFRASTAYDLDLGVKFVTFFRPRSFVRRLDITSGNEYGYEDEDYYLRPNQISFKMLSLMRGTTFYDRYKNKFCSELNHFFASPTTRKELFQMINDKYIPEYLYGEIFVKELCRRRERKLLIHLVNSDENEAERVTALALDMLQSKKVRGRKEEMIRILLMKQWKMKSRVKLLK